MHMTNRQIAESQNMQLVCRLINCVADRLIPPSQSTYAAGMEIDQLCIQ